MKTYEARERCIISQLNFFLMSLVRLCNWIFVWALGYKIEECEYGKDTSSQRINSSSIENGSARNCIDVCQSLRREFSLSQLLFSLIFYFIALLSLLFLPTTTIYCYSLGVREKELSRVSRSRGIFCVFVALKQISLSLIY